ncbi:MFS transporter [Microbacterium sp. PA5]|uniref:MFS transporter n=1 Tax=Microbacterium sp. PA5 TaxID=3416654 RepID=UPI003CFB7F35
MVRGSDDARIWTRPFAALFGINFVITFAQFMTLALMPKLADSLGATSITVGIVTGIFAVTALAVRPAVGWATLHTRHSHLLAATVLMIVCAFVLYAVATNIEVLIAARLLHGAAMGFLAPVTLAMASNVLPSSRMAQGIGIFSLGQAVSTAVGPSVGLLLLASFGYTSSFLTGAGLLLAAAVAAFGIRSPRPAGADGVRFGWRAFVATEAIVPATVMFCLGGAFSGVNTFIVLYGESRGVEQIGLFFAAYAAFILLSRPLAGRLADVYGLPVVIIPGMIMFAVSFVVISQATTLTGFLVAGAISALGYGICQPAIQTMSLTSVSPQRRGVASNTNYIGLDLGYLVLPIIAGWVISTHVDAGAAPENAYSQMYLLLIAPVTVGLLVYLLFKGGGRRRRSPSLPPPPA